MVLELAREESTMTFLAILTMLSNMMVLVILAADYCGSKRAKIVNIARGARGWDLGLHIP